MKYIIEYEDEPSAENSDKETQYYNCKNIPWWTVSESNLKRLTPYTDDGKDKLWSAFRDALDWNTDNRMAAFGYCNTADWFDVFDPDSFIKMVDEYNKLIKREDDMNELVTETLRMAEKQNFSLEAVIVALMNIKQTRDYNERNK